MKTANWSPPLFGGMRVAAARHPYTPKPVPRNKSDAGHWSGSARRAAGTGAAEKSIGANL